MEEDQLAVGLHITFSTRDLTVRLDSTHFVSYSRKQVVELGVLDGIVADMLTTDDHIAWYDQEWFRRFTGFSIVFDIFCRDPANSSAWDIGDFDTVHFDTITLTPVWESFKREVALLHRE